MYKEKAVELSAHIAIKDATWWNPVDTSSTVTS